MSLSHCVALWGRYSINFWKGTSRFAMPVAFWAVETVSFPKKYHALKYLILIISYFNYFFSRTASSKTTKHICHSVVDLEFASECNWQNKNYFFYSSTYFRSLMSSWKTIMQKWTMRQSDRQLSIRQSLTNTDSQNEDNSYGWNDITN